MQEPKQEKTCCMKTYNKAVTSCICYSFMTCLHLKFVNYRKERQRERKKIRKKERKKEGKKERKKERVIL